MIDIHKAMSERRWCYYIAASQDPSKHGGYVPSVVIEGISGHYPAVGKPDGAPWVWGRTLAEAEAVCREQNKRKGITIEDETKIVASSMRAQHEN